MLVGTARSADASGNLLLDSDKPRQHDRASGKKILSCCTNPPQTAVEGLHSFVERSGEAVTILRDMDSLKTLLKPLAEDGAQLTREQARDVLRQILSGEAPEVETAALLTVFATRGEQAPELAGFVDVMREQCVPVPLTDDERTELVDC